MESNRVNLDNHKSTYLILTFILIVLSIIGLVLLYQIIQTRSNTSEEPVVPTSVPTQAISPTVTLAPTASVTAKLSPTVKPTSTPKLTPTPKVTSILSPTLTPVPTSSTSVGLLNYTNQEDKFSIDYSSSRKLYADKESSGNRYTFTHPQGNFAVHVGLNGKWAWINSDREFTKDLLIAGQPTFKYETSSQTVVDLQYDSNNYTLQCIHNSKTDLKTECDQFMESFKLL